MAKIKLPEPLKFWKVVSRLSDENGKEIYKVSKKEADGSKTEAKLTCFSLAGDDYSDENAEYLIEEADFIRSISRLDNVSNYIDVAAENDNKKQRINFYIITEDCTALSDVMANKDFSENEVVDFGLQMSEILEKLEANNIFHGNINPYNIFLTQDGKYKLGGFIDAESAIDDLSFIAPEIHSNEPADFTTDIYSLGLIMYSMCNSGKLPFESGGLSKNEAIQKRFSESGVSAPANGSEKLKSVIVIACQNENKNRWKNAGNLKNALSSIKAELLPVQKNEVIVPESTDFDGNVFEEYTYDEFESDTEQDLTETAEETPVEEAVSVAVTAPEAEANDGEFENTVEGGNAEEADNAAENTKPTEPEQENNGASDNGNTADEPTDGADLETVIPSYQEPEIDNRIFDDYEMQTKVFSINEAEKKEEKDYGDFFDDYDEGQEDKDTAAEKTVIQTPSGSYDENAFITDSGDSEITEKSRKGLVVGIIIGIVILIALLAAFGVLAVKNGLFNGINNTNNRVKTTLAADATAASTAQPQTTQPTTAALTTAEPTESSEKAVLSVVGYGYYYAKDLLEADGFNVEVGEYRYSDVYDEGYVISQSPSGDSTAEKGSTITLVVSLGHEQTEDDNQASENDSASSVNSGSGSGGNSASYSSYKNNTSYLSQAEVDAMSRSELNIALNEIYARRGRIFTDPQLASYFNSQSWYKPTYTAEEFSANVVLNDYEKKNINLIYNEQVERGYR